MIPILQWLVWLVLALWIGVIVYWLIDDDDDCEEDY